VRRFVKHSKGKRIYTLLLPALKLPVFETNLILNERALGLCYAFLKSLKLRSSGNLMMNDTNPIIDKKHEAARHSVVFRKPVSS